MSVKNYCKVIVALTKWLFLILKSNLLSNKVIQDVGNVLSKFHCWFVEKKNAADILRVAQVRHYFNTCVLFSEIY